MANARPGYKRIMGEIPEEMHEKITLYNKISDRPLNVSRAIELCMQQAVKKIDDELEQYAHEHEYECGMTSDEIYEAIKKDIDGGEVGANAIHKHFIELLKNQGPLNEMFMKMIIFPIDHVTLDITGTILFCAGGAVCFILGSEFHQFGYDSKSKSSNEE